MVDFKIIGVVGVVSVLNVRRNYEYAAEFCFYTLIFDIMPTAPASNNIDFIKRMLVHKYREYLRFIVIIGVAQKEIFVIFEDEIVCVKSNVVILITFPGFG